MHALEVTDWHVWHEQYGDQDSSLSRRLEVVRRTADKLVADLGPMQRVLSLCAGDGRDIIPVFARRSPQQRPGLVLVELDPALAATAEQRAREAGVEVTVVTGDAGVTETWQGWLPVDVLMLCGIFGNISDEDIRATISASSSMVRPGGAVIWTRGYIDERDLRPQVRRWYDAAGFREITYDEEPHGYGVGSNRATEPAAADPLPARLFTFIR